MSEGPTQYEQENDLGRGGGEVDDDTMETAWKDAAEKRGDAKADQEDGPLGDEGADQPWAKTSSGDVDNPDL